MKSKSSSPKKQKNRYTLVVCSSSSTEHDTTVHRYVSSYLLAQQVVKEHGIPQSFVFDCVDDELVRFVLWLAAEHLDGRIKGNPPVSWSFNGNNTPTTQKAAKRLEAWISLVS
jgi:hypothetical protein